MANITAAMIKELREATGAGMLDVKKALEAVDGDFDKAVDFLREKGLAGAAKKAGRIAAEGIVDVVVSCDSKKAVLVEVNAETDFVAKNEKFRTYVAEVTKQALNTKSKDIDEFLKETWELDTTLTVEEKLSSMVSIIGEKMTIRRFKQVDALDGFVGSYIHGDGKIGVLVNVKTALVSDATKELAKNIAMQIAALNPLYVSQKEVDSDYIQKETDIIKAQIMNDPKESQKPEKVIEGMIKGRINKQLKEICLLDQAYVKAADGKQTVEAYIKEAEKALDTSIEIVSFVRFETGEGIEKKNEDFAQEVAKQMASL